MPIVRHTLPIFCTAAIASLIPVAPAGAQMVTGHDMPGFNTVFGLDTGKAARGVTVREIAVKTPTAEGANVLWPGEEATFTFRLVNKTGKEINADGAWEVIPYGTTVQTGDIWTPHVFALGNSRRTPLKVTIPANGEATVSVQPPIPTKFGGYALIADLGAAGRAFAATLVRVPKPDPGRVQYPTYALDLGWPFEVTEASTVFFERVGIKGCRFGAGYYPLSAGDFDKRYAEFAQQLGWAEKHNITVMLTIGEGGGPQPLGRPRPWLDDKGVMLDTKSDAAWLPELDPDFRKWTAQVAGKWGWPGGPVNAVELWNEPWEGISISGWGADMIRYRDLYKNMALGVMDARKEKGVNVLIGGACSSSNTRDKLFSDGTLDFLPYLDFVSIHYQPLAADPAVEKIWVGRKAPSGPVRVWDTESWIANSEDRVAGVIASMRAQGQERTAGIYQGNVFESQVLSDKPRLGIIQAWSPAAAVAASQKFIGQRRFKEILFKNGLPWVFSFEGTRLGERTGPADDGTLVVVGDLGGVYDRKRVLWQQITGLKNREKVLTAQKRLNTLPATATDNERNKAEQELATAQVVEGATMTITNPAGEFVLYDFYGNPAESSNGKIVVPLNGLGYFLRTSGKPGSFARLTEAVRTARIDGYTPVEIVLHDFTERPTARTMQRVTLHNILNRQVSGKLTVTPEGSAATREVALQPFETRIIELPGPPTIGPQNGIRYEVVFDAGKDGQSFHSETLHANVIAKKTITVDGDLNDWKGVLPQSVSAGTGGPSLTEFAYQPFKAFDPGVKGGQAVGYLAYDDKNFYFAAKIADSTPYPGNVRFETRDDDQYFYPARSFTHAGAGETALKEMDWPAGVRRFSYRKDPDLPSGNGTDNVQIAFNVLPPEKKSWLPHPPGTMDHFIVYQDTDYEFALNSVAEQFGGGAEIWCLQKPGMMRKHFYPRQPKAPGDGGPVKAGHLVMKRDATTRMVECSIPWSEMPEVKARIDAGQTIKFTFRVNDNRGPAYELAAGRSVSKDNSWTFHNDWAGHWANELEFGAEK